MSWLEEWFQTKRNYLEKLSQDIFVQLKTTESLSLSCHWESSQFHRLTQSKVRQSTEVEQATLSCGLIFQSRSVDFVFTLSGHFETDRRRALSELKAAQELIAFLPEHPFCPRHENYGKGESIHTGRSPDEQHLFDELLGPLNQIDLAGIYSGGAIMKALLNSLGQRHYFVTESYQFDYSLYTGKQRAVKGNYSTRNWDGAQYGEVLKRKVQQLTYMDRPRKKIEPGKYRVYLSPEAVDSLVHVLNWGGVSYRSLREGQSPLTELQEAKKKMSSQFSLNDDYSLGLAPRFNYLGELCDENIEIISQGNLKNFLVNAQSALEYQVASTRASSTESMRSACIAGGKLKVNNILQELGTGLYLDNLHYLNWSDLNHARITGMTRFACFWVENGEIQGPIEDLRFDETLYHLWGEGLVDLTQERSIILDSSTYGQRSVGGNQVPGMLIEAMNFTL